MDEGTYQCAASTEPPAYSSLTISVLAPQQHTGRMKGNEDQGHVRFQLAPLPPPYHLNILPFFTFSLHFLSTTKTSAFIPSLPRPLF